MNGRSELGGKMKIIRDRRSVRDYTDKKIKKNQVEQLLNAARWAPSAGNAQPWLIKAIKGKKVNKIKRLTPGIYGSPPVIIVLCLDKNNFDDEIMDRMGIAIAAQNICLQATSMDLGTCIVASFDETTIEKILNIEESIIPILLVTVGYPEKIPEPPDRKKLEEFVEWIGW